MLPAAAVVASLGLAGCAYNTNSEEMVDERGVRHARSRPALQLGNAAGQEDKNYPFKLSLNDQCYFSLENSKAIGDVMSQNGRRYYSCDHGP